MELGKTLNVVNVVDAEDTVATVNEAVIITDNVEVSVKEKATV